MFNKKISADDFVKNFIYPSIQSPSIDKFFKRKSIVFSDEGLNELSRDVVNEIFYKKNFFYSLTEGEPFRIIQETLNVKFLKNIPISSSAKAFRENTSYFDFIEPHAKNYNFVRIDVKNFFHSIRESDLRECFSVYFKDQKLSPDSEQSILDCFIIATTLVVDDSFSNKKSIGKRILPIGFSTSPLIANILFRKVDVLIEKLCARLNVTYTRYADDLLFSSDKNERFIFSDQFSREIGLLLSLLGLKINKKKTIKKSHTISLNGFVIQSKQGKNYSNPFKENNISEYKGIRVSNKKTKKIYKAISLLSNEHSYIDVLKIAFEVNMEKSLDFNNMNSRLLENYAKSQVINRLAGYRSFILSLLIYNNRFECLPNIVVEKYNSLVKNIEVTIKKIH
ncbi:reverse transcriptase domain-containing protein [uncultured Shewanella sp.]|uniref:reverse transcriptase domain-containing protein n=1 Tax=uncultured Shewanella sp. TaxID=173975 RepID=UPI00261E4ED4|nr:reverse transcriptase domain-containing protein [uncultured Shewanella sp.]